MNRAKKTAQYIYEKIDRLIRYRSTLTSKDAFYSSLSSFKSELIDSLKKTGLIEEQRLIRLSDLFSEIDKTKTKTGRPNEVYWNAVNPLFDTVVKELNDLIRKLNAIKIPTNILFYDFMINNWRWLITSLIAIIALIVAIFGKCR
jgi:hypothetical protein